MVLEDHVSRGKKRIPKLLAGPIPFQDTTWHTERLPELFWLAIALNRLSYRDVLERSFEMANEIDLSLRQIRGNEVVTRALLMSEHLALSVSEKQRLFTTHNNAPWMLAFSPIFADLKLIWPEVPVAYLAPNPANKSIDELTAEVRELLSATMDRNDGLAIAIQSVAVMTEIRTGHLMFLNGVEPPDLNAVFDYPETEASQHAAGFIKVNCTSMIFRGRDKNKCDFDWQRMFWNGCFKLQGCEYD